MEYLDEHGCVYLYLPLPALVARQLSYYTTREGMREFVDPAVADTVCYWRSET